MQESSHQLAAIMFTDIVGYTTIMGEDDTKALSILAKNREIHKRLIAKYHGELLKEMGDGTLASFSSAINGVRCAIEIQQKASLSPVTLNLRIGIHLGDITRDNKDVFGEGVNIASRLQSIADPGAIFISEDIQHIVRVHKDVEVQYLGVADLKNVSEPVKTFAVRGPGLPMSKPIKGPGVRPKLLSIITLFVIFLLSVLIIWQFDLFNSGDAINSVAIMSFENLSADQVDQAFFAQGMTNTLITNLSKVAALKVKIYHDLSSSIKPQKSVSAIGRELGVDAIIQGAVIREGNLVRITAQLIDVTTEELLWTESYDRDITSILKLHSEVAQAIVKEVQVVVTVDESVKLKYAPKVDALAYESLLKGFYHLYKLNPDHYDSALMYFDEALRLGSVNAQANTGLALVWVHKGQWGGEAPLVAATKARTLANRALKQDSTLAMTHLALAHVYTSFEWNWKAAVEEFQKAISLNPSMPETRLFYADLLVSLNQEDEAITQIEAALNIDPFNAFSYTIKGWVLFATGNHEDAIIALNKALEDEPMMPLAHRCLWSIYHLGRKYDLANKHAILFYRSQDLKETAVDLELYSQESGYSKALRIAADNLANMSDKKYFSSMRVARLYAFSGDNDLAIHWLKKAYDEHYVSFFSLNVDPHWYALHKEPEFIELVNRMNLVIQ